MLKRCGLRPGHCRNSGSCDFALKSWADETEWHVLAGLAADCLFFVPKDCHVEIRNRRPVVILSKCKPLLRGPWLTRRRKPRS